MYIVQYRTRDRRQRRRTIGPHGAMTTEQARLMARQWLADAYGGNDRAAVKDNARAAPTFGTWQPITSTPPDSLIKGGPLRSGCSTSRICCRLYAETANGPTPEIPSICYPKRYPEPFPKAQEPSQLAYKSLFLLVPAAGIEPATS